MKHLQIFVLFHLILTTNHMSKALLSTPKYKWRNWGPEVNLPEYTQLGGASQVAQWQSIRLQCRRHRQMRVWFLGWEVTLEEDFVTPWTGLPGSSVYGILQARIWEWVAIPFSRGSFQDPWAQGLSPVSGRFFTTSATWEALWPYERKKGLSGVRFMWPRGL